MFVRVTRTVNDRGVLVRPQDIGKTVTDPQVDWYRSAYTYGEDAKEYWESNNDSIKGYTGETFSSELWFDLDCESNPAKAKKASVDLLTHLSTLGWVDATEIFFSGFKGFHIIVHTKNRFVPSEVSIICYNLAKEAGVPIGADGVFDTSVYNITRIFRLPNTRHQKTGLYKIPLTLDELRDKKIDEIKELASEPRYEEFDVKPVDAEVLKTKYKAIQKDKPVLTSVEGGATDISQSPVDFSMCPPGHRKCIYALEQGDISPSQRHEAIMRLAAFYKANGFSREHAGEMIFDALEKRHDIYIDANQTNEAECNRDIDQVYNKDWRGGMFTCKTDVFLQLKCDQGNGPCYNDARVKMRQVMTIEQLYHKYVKYGEEALIEYPKFGIKWVDERVRLRPRNFSVLAGANGSGKTSIMVELMESLNKQKMYHAFFSLDMADSSFFEKVGAKYTPYSQSQIETAFNVNTKNTTIMKEVLEALRKHLPYTLMDFTSAATMQYMETTVMGLRQVYENLQVVIVDYAGRILGEFENQYASSTQNAMSANDVAKRTSCHWVYLAQVSRENGDHTDPLRTSRVSKDSGAWEENATCVLTCWRPLGNGINGKDDYIHMYIAKNRSGPLGENVFGWEGKTGKIRELRQDEFDEYCVELESLGEDRPRFAWFDDKSEQNVADDVPVSDRGRNSGRFTDGPRIQNNSASKIKFAAAKLKEIRDEGKKVVTGERVTTAASTASQEVQKLAQEQRRDDREVVQSDRPVSRFRRGDRSTPRS